MSQVWGVHGARPQFEFLRERRIALDRPGVGDLRRFGDDPHAVIACLREAYPEEKDGTLRIWTSVLLRFSLGPAQGDAVVLPDPKRRTISVGRITGEYAYVTEPHERHVREVEWIVTGHPRDDLSAGARQAVSQRVAFFEVKDADAAAELLALLPAGR